MSTKNESKTPKTKTPKTAPNNEKINATTDFTALYNELIVATTKKQLVDSMKNHGLQCVTAPTTTPNTNDLYLQFNANKCGDVSRVQITSKSIKLWCTKSVATAFVENDNKTPINDLLEKQFDSVNDGSVRKYRKTISKTVENFIAIMNKLQSIGVIVPLVK